MITAYRILLGVLLAGTTLSMIVFIIAMVLNPMSETTATSCTAMVICALLFAILGMFVPVAVFFFTGEPRMGVPW